MDDLLDTAPCGFVSFLDDGTISAVNRTLTELLGYDRDDLLGKHVERLLTVAGRIFYQTHFFPLVKLHGKAEEIFLTLRARDGEDVPVLANAVRREESGTAVSHCVVIPVHQRRKYEDEILAARRQAEEALASNADLIQARHDLERHTRELDRKVSRLEQRNAELVRFSTILSHDLREPIRKLSVFAGILRQENKDVLTPMGARAVETIGAEALRLDTLIRGLYGYVSLDATDEQLQEVDLTDVLQAAQANAAAAYGVKLLITVADGLPVVEGYRRQLEQLFTQLLDNAVKFRRPEQAPRVRITCREVQENSFRATEGRYRYVDHARITIEDEGIGFEERYGAYIFEALRKIDPKTPGLGLGLAICKKVVEHHYGSIRAEPRPGGGSRFIVSLPMRQ